MRRFKRGGCGRGPAGLFPIAGQEETAMSRLNPLIAAGAAATLALAGCGAPAENEAAANRNAVAESRTENGQLTVRAQGVDLKIDLPPPLRRMAGDDGNRAFVYPGAAADARAEGGVIAFHSDDAPETVARWYRDPARANRFTVATDERQGPALVIAGTARNGDGLAVRLTPGEGGGTDGRVVITARD
jgi:hypothetical protein